MSTRPIGQFDCEVFVRDLESAAAVIEAPFDRETTRRMTALFAPELRQGVVQLRVASLPGSPLNYRVGCLEGVDWAARAVETGAASAQHQGLQFLTALRQRFPRSSYLGGDFDAARGLEKIYLLFAEPVPLTGLLAVPGLPAGLVEQQQALREHQLDQVVICAADLTKGSVNVYFVWRQPSAEWLNSFASHWRQPAVPPALSEEILRSAKVHGSLATTWSHDRPIPRRWCVYAIALRYDRPELYRPGQELEGCRLPERGERFLRFDRAAGSQTDRVAYGLGWSFGEPAPFVKYERSYSGDLLEHYLAQTKAVAPRGEAGAR